MANEESKKITKRVWTGEVVSDKNDKTIVVKVDRVRIHPIYKKRITVSKKYHVHDPENRHKVGEMVSFVESRPYSKQKHWQVIDK